jgi:hypothetical protein
MVDKMPKNWKLIDKRKSNNVNYLTVFRFWTWFKRPYEEMTFLDTTSVRKLNNNIFYANIYSAYLTEKDNQTIKFFDIHEKKSTSFQSKDEIKDLTLEEIKKGFWISISEGSRLYNVLEYYEGIKPYFTINSLGKEIEVTNYILSGIYKLKDPTNKYQVYLIKTIPYSIPKEDEALIISGLRNWLTENNVLNYKLPISISQSAQYLYSQVYMYTPADVYEIDVVLNENPEKDLTIHFTFTDQYFSKQFFPDFNQPRQIVVLNE